MPAPNQFGVTAAMVAAKLGEAAPTTSSRPSLASYDGVIGRKAGVLRDVWSNRGVSSDTLVDGDPGYSASVEYVLAAAANDIANTLNRGEAAAGFAAEAKRAMALIEHTPSSISSVRTDAATSVSVPASGSSLADMVIRGGL